MILNQIKRTFRILLKQKRITLINMFGLSISLACALFMLLWVEHELSFDRFHQDFRQLYRVEEDQYYAGPEPYHVNVTPYVSGPEWKDGIPEIVEQCRMARTGGMLFRYADNKFFEDGIFAVDASFFSLFSFDFLYGGPDAVLRDPYSIVLTEETSTKYFGDENPIGKTFQVNEEYVFTVTGVLKKLPENTVLKFNILTPWSFMEAESQYSDSWWNNSVQTFVKLQGGSSDTVVNRKIDKVTEIYNEYNTIDFKVAPLHKIHLFSYSGLGHPPGAILYVYIFSAIALFVLIIACINFMNLSTARSSIRAKEIGLRKVSGASRRQLVRQHLFESFVQTAGSVLLAFLMVYALLHKFNQISGKDIESVSLFSIQFILGIASILIITTLLAGSYPALFLSSLEPLRAIKDSTDPRKGSGLLRKILVVFQFSLAVLLITGALIASRQLNFMRNAELGFNKTELVHIQLRGNLNQEYEMLKGEFVRDPRITGITASMESPYQIGSSLGPILWDGKDPELAVLVSSTGVHYDFVETMGITMQSGRGFSEEFPADMQRDTLANFIMNETMADIIGWDEIVGMDLEFVGIHGQVVGVMEDYHFQPLGNDIEPMVLIPRHQENLQHMIVRLDPGDPQGGLQFMEDKWEEVLPQYPFEYTYVEDVIHDMYLGENRMASLLKMFTLVAIIIASLGLFALASFTAERRTREMGIRKIMGAVEYQITVMMIRDFSLYIIISLLIALPAVWFIARWWLNEFSFKIDLKPDLFILTSLITTLVAILTVLYHALRTARTNPVDALRSE